MKRLFEGDLSPSHLKGCVEKVAAFGRPIVPTQKLDEPIAISNSF